MLSQYTGSRRTPCKQVRPLRGAEYQGSLTSNLFQSLVDCHPFTFQPLEHTLLLSSLRQQLEYNMYCLSLLNQKGGTGKTTSVVSLADIWEQSGYDVLTIDMDPQASLSLWVHDRSHLCTDLLLGKKDVGNTVVGTEWGFDLVPSSRSLSNLEESRDGDVPERLDKLLKVGEQVYDVCLIDPPPSTGFLVSLSVAVSDEIVAPVQTGQGAIDGLIDTRHLTNTLGGTLGGLFACRVDERTVNDREMPGILKDNFPDEALDTYIRETVSVKEAEADGTPLPTYASDATATEDYKSLANELEFKIDEPS